MDLIDIGTTVNIKRSDGESKISFAFLFLSVVSFMHAVPSYPSGWLTVVAEAVNNALLSSFIGKFCVGHHRTFQLVAAHSETVVKTNGQPIDR